MKRLYCAFVYIILISFSQTAAQYNISDSGYFEKPGFNMLVFNNDYPQGHQGGLEIIQHGNRIATNGDLRLEATPGQWNLVPTLTDKRVEKHQRSIFIDAEYADLNIQYHIHVQSVGNAFKISINLDHPIPFQWVGKVGFNLEFLPSAFMGKGYILDEHYAVFPQQSNSHIKTVNNKVHPLPIASGKKLSLAPNDPECFLQIESQSTELLLFDGRSTDNNGWFVVRSIIPGGVSEKAIEWTITPHVQNNWLRKPVILHSQVGYHPDQAKTALIELDQRDRKIYKTFLYRIQANGQKKLVQIDKPQVWGDFLRYQYLTFDFSNIQQEGLYQLRYNDEYSDIFRISKNIFNENMWQPTLTSFFPVQMCHMQVRDRFRTWHGLCHMDDALQAPALQEHFDGYAQKESSDTDFFDYDHLDGLNIGGWHDAGDYDLATGSQAETVKILSLIYEEFHVFVDQTYIDSSERFVELHRQDTKNDLLQQIEHGVKFLLAPYHISDHSFIGIISPTLEQYVHLGDAATMTDNKVYNASMDLLKKAEFRRGKMDDRWVFTNKDTGLEFKVCETLAGAARTLSIYNDSLSTACLEQAKLIWSLENAHEPVQTKAAYVPRDWQVQKILAAVELYLTTRDSLYIQELVNMQDEVFKNTSKVAWSIVRMADDIHDEHFNKNFMMHLRSLAPSIQKSNESTPFGVAYRPGIWGGGWNLQHQAMQQYFLYTAHPEIFKKDIMFNVLNFVLGCHPGSNISFVSGIGTHSMTTAYGANRAEFSYIPGGVVSGTALIKPDFPELIKEWPYIWQQSEYVISGAASYIFCVLAAESLIYN